MKTKTNIRVAVTAGLGPFVLDCGTRATRRPTARHALSLVWATAWLVSGPAVATAQDGSVLQFSSTRGDVGEAHGTVSLGVRRAGVATDTVTVDYRTAEGTATAGLDYEAVAGTLTFAPDETERTIEVPILNDGLREENETFTVTIGNLQGAGEIGPLLLAEVTIMDNDPGVQWSRSPHWVTEGGDASFIVTRGNDVELGAFTVDYATSDGGARAGLDYEAVAGTLSFAAGESERAIVIPIYDDELTESSDHFVATLSNVQGNAALGNRRRTTINILDNVITLALRSGETLGRASERETVTFRYSPSRLPVSVVGDLSELGNGDVAQAVPLVRDTNDGWQVAISLPANRTYSYRFSSGRVPLTEPSSAHTREATLRPAAKSIWYRSALSDPIVHWRQSKEEPFTLTEARAVGSGKPPGGMLWLAGECGEAGREIEFFITDAAQERRDPRQGSYWTALDVFLVQDGELFTYMPAARVSPRRRDYDPVRVPAIQSSILGGEQRPYRVMLPRGYSEHLERRYPVIYFHDGQWMWEAGQVDPEGDVLAGLVRWGLVGEFIAVGVDVGPDLLSSRTRDYLPPGDQDSGIQGAADRYVEFLTKELKPLIDAHYRTQPGPESTFTAGFSFGGLVALYMGWDFDSVFTRVGAISGSFGPSFTGRLMRETKRDIRVYLDSGDDGPSGVLALRNILLSKSPPFVLEDDLRHRYAPGRQHIFEDFRVRLPAMLSFLYPASEEPNELIPRIAIAGAVSGEPSVRLRVTGPAGVTGRLQRSADLQTWTDRQTVTLARESVEVFDTDGTATPDGFYRLVVP